MADNTPLTPIVARFLQRLKTVNILSLFPLIAVVAYWVNVDGILFVVSFLFPLLLVFQGGIQHLTQPSVDVTAMEKRDYLTGLFNRQHVIETITDFLSADKGRETAVLHIDLEQFRRINDQFGQDAGDRILVEVAARIKSCVRDNDVVARINGDDFAIALFPLQKLDVSVILAIAERVHAAIAKPFPINNTTCTIGCSIGVCLSGRAPNRDAESILKSAELALDLARKEGPGTTRSFSPQMRSEARKLNHISKDLEAALQNGEIRPYFQPQISTETGKVIGFEALARWQHPTDGLILPGLFLKAIENAGKSERLGEVILFHSLTALKAWDRAGLAVASVGVNFSSQELRNPKLVEKIKWEVDRFDIAPARITIEVLENVISDHDEDIVTRNIRALATQGFSIDLDDFGTGHASISNIRRFAVNRIKIDRSFVTNIDQDKNQRVMTSAIINMADSLGLDVLAEGVENIGEQTMLSQLGCRYVQGFGIARPMPFEETIGWITTHNQKLDPGPILPRKTG